MVEFTGRQILGLSGGRAADLAQQVDELQAKVADIGGAMRAAAEVEVEGASADGTVLATVNELGSLLGLRITPAAMRDLDNVALGAAVLEAIVTARQTASRQFAGRIEETSGEKIPDPAETELPDDPLAELRGSLGGR